MAKVPQHQRRRFGDFMTFRWPKALPEDLVMLARRTEKWQLRKHRVNRAIIKEIQKSTNVIIYYIWFAVHTTCMMYIFFLYINMITYKMFICVHQVYIHTQSHTYVVISICSPVYMTNHTWFCQAAGGSVEITSPQDRNVCPEAATRAVAWSRWVEGSPRMSWWLVGQFHTFCCHGCEWISPGKTLCFSLDRNWDRHLWQKPTVFLQGGSRMSKVPCSMKLPLLFQTMCIHLEPSLIFGRIVSGIPLFGNLARWTQPLYNHQY